MKLCNLLLYSVKEVALEVLLSHEAGFMQGIIENLEMDVNDKLHFYEMRNDKLIVISTDDPDVNLSDESTIVVVDLLSLGQSSLNNHSFARSDSVEEKHQALKCFQAFHDTLKDDNSFLKNLAIACRHNSFISGNLDPLHDEMPIFGKLENALDLAKREHFGQCDHLITASKFFTHKTCNVLHSQILRLNWVEILDKGSSVKVEVHQPSNPADCLEISIDSNVFDLCRSLQLQLQDHSKINASDNLTVLGRGGFGNTFKYDTVTRSNYVISIVIKENMIREIEKDEKPAWYREAVHTRQLCHDNIIKYLGKPILYKNRYYCLMEFGGMSLHGKYFNKSDMKPSDICTAMLHISRAIDYLHRQIGETVVIHRDIRTSNVTVSDQGVYKLIDFGISSEKSVLDSKICSDVNFGNVLWKSPEYCQYLSWGRTDGPGRKSDIWMFGVFTMEMMSFPLRPPFFDEYGASVRHMAFVNGMANGSIDLIEFLSNNDNHRSILEVTKKCLIRSEESRIDSKKLLAHCEGLQNA